MHKYAIFVNLLVFLLSSSTSGIAQENAEIKQNTQTLYFLLPLLKICISFLERQYHFKDQPANFGNNDSPLDGDYIIKSELNGENVLVIFLLWRVCYHSNVCFGEKKIPLDCLIYGQVYTENVSGGSMHSLTESTPHWDQTDLCSNPYSWEQ